ncbi:MAG: ABC transporter substrate-binding protein [Bulleidia sp.]
MNRKRWCIAVCAALLSALIVVPRKIVLRIGIFAGSYWDVPSGDSYRIIDEAIARFEKSHPNIIVEYHSGVRKDDYSEWLSDQVMLGEVPDVYMVMNEDFTTFSSLGALKKLDGYMQEAGFSTDDYYDSVIEAGKYQEHQYALPYECNPTLMFVNRTLLDKEGIEIPDNGWTLSEFYSICRRVTKDTDGDGVIDQFGCYNYDWMDSAYAYGISLFNEDGTSCNLTQDSLKQAITFVEKLNALNGSYQVSSKEFDEGKVAFAPMTFAAYRTYKPYPWRVKKFSAFEWDCVKMPSVSGTEGKSEISSLLMGISSRTCYGKEAWEILKEFTYSKQAQTDIIRYSQGLSPLKGIMQSQNVLDSIREQLGDSRVDLSVLDEVMEQTTQPSQFRLYSSALNLIDTGIRTMVDNGDDMDLSLMKMQKEINRYLRG